MYHQKLIIIFLLLIKFNYLDDFVHSLIIANQTKAVNKTSIKLFQSKISKNKTVSKFREEEDDEDERNEEDYQDNEGIDNQDNVEEVEDANQDEEPGDDGGGDGGGDGDGDSGGDEGGGDEGGGDGGGDGDDGAQDGGEGGGATSDAPPPDGGGGGDPGGGGDGGGQPGTEPPTDPGQPPPTGGGDCPNPDTVFSTANAWRVRLLSQVCQLSNYLLYNFHFFKYKHIIKKLQHLIMLLSYNQSNMNLEEMVRFLQTTQNNYNQLLSSYVGVFYILKKCQYKNLCFDCAIVTGQLAKLIQSTNYTNQNNQIQLSDKTIYYLLKSIEKSNNKINKTQKINPKGNKHLNSIKLIKTKFTIIQPINVKTNSSHVIYNLTEILEINKKLNNQFNRLTKKVIKIKHIKHVKKKKN